mgnify:FL=1
MEDNEIKFLASHEWARLEDNGWVTVGISEHAQDQLGDIVFIELPEVGQELIQRKEAAIVESVKAASEIFSPVSGEVTEVNLELIDNPEMVNSSPFQNGWFYKIKPSNESDLNALLSEEEYKKSCEN